MKSGWVTKKLGEVCEVVLGGTPRTSVPEYWGGSVPWLTPGDMGKIQGLYVDKTSRTLTQKGLENGSSLFPANSVVLSTRAPIGYVLINSVPMCTNQGCKTIVPGTAIIPKFLAYNLIGRAIELNELGTGTTFKELATGVLKNIDIPIPPLAEQKRIVAKIDAAFEKIDALKANAEKNLANAKELFQSALDEAMRPKKGWVEKRLGEVCSKIVDGDHNPPKGVEKSNYLMLSSKNIQNGALIFDNPRYLSKIDFEITSKRTNVSYGDVLVTIVGTIGRSCVYTHNQPIALQRSVAVLKPNKISMNSWFLMYYLQSMTTELETKGHGAAQKGLYLKELSSVCVYLPSVDEQKRIVAQLDALSKKNMTLQQNYAQQIADCAEMKQAVLREAFEGRL